MFYSSLLAVSLDDFEIYVVDIDMRRVVRIFRGHTNRVTDMVGVVHFFLHTSTPPSPQEKPDTQNERAGKKERDLGKGKGKSVGNSLRCRRAKHVYNIVLYFALRKYNDGESN